MFFTNCILPFTAVVPKCIWLLSYLGILLSCITIFPLHNHMYTCAVVGQSNSVIHEGDVRNSLRVDLHQRPEEEQQHRHIISIVSI